MLCTVGHHTAALRFFFCKKLKRAYPIEEVPYQLMAMHIDFGQRLADQATGALSYALNVRKP
jgi:hypothetical protein